MKTLGNILWHFPFLSFVSTPRKSWSVPGFAGFVMKIKRELLKLMIVIGMTLMTSACMTMQGTPVKGGPQFPEPSAGYSPKEILPYSKSHVLDFAKSQALEDRIMIGSEMNDQFTTDWIEGPRVHVAGGLLADSSYRYKYTVLVTESISKQTKLQVFAKLETMSRKTAATASADWHGATLGNEGLIKSIENAFRERIENRLNNLKK